MVELLPSKQAVARSNRVSRSNLSMLLSAPCCTILTRVCRSPMKLPRPLDCRFRLLLLCHEAYTPKALLSRAKLRMLRLPSEYVTSRSWTEHR